MSELKIGQEWYFYKESTSYIIYDIEHQSFQYKNGEEVQSIITIKLRSLNNKVKTCSNDEFNENDCKLLKDVDFILPTKEKIIPIQEKSRLESI